MKSLIYRLVAIVASMQAFAQEQGHDHSQHGGDPGFNIQEAFSFSGFFKGLFSADFMPHGHCYWWKPEIVWLQIISNASIALAYFSIPVMVFNFTRRRKDLPFPRLFLLFASFIFWCGVTHVLDIVVIYHPVYRLDGIVRAITGGISVLTAFLLFPVIPQALALKSPRELEEKNKELDLAYQKLQKSEKLKDEFFAGVSHELRTPLTLILAPVESALAGDLGVLAPKQKEALRTVQNNAIRLLQMVTGLLDFSKLEAGRVDVKRQPTDVVALTEALFADFKISFERKSLKGSLKFNITDNVLSVDRYLYERIFFNLVSNAVKFTPAGGRIDVEVSMDGETFKLCVQDTGIGISKEDQASIFHKFHQVDSSATRRFEGTGLGLALVKEFTELLDGQVSVESEVGKGSRFTISFTAPRAKQVAADAPRERKQTLVNHEALPGVRVSPAKPAKSLGKVLVAEDNPELSSYITSLLEEFCEVRSVSDGEAVLSQVKVWRPDLVISDVMMPKKDGFLVCKEIKADKSISMTPVVLLTALTYREAMLKGWNAGADEYLFKPFHPKELQTRIQNLLRLSNERKLRQSEQQRREELEEFSHIASHDLKEPLRTVATYSQLLQRQYQGQLSNDADTYIGFINDNAKRMQQLMDDLASYSKVGKKEGFFGPVSTESSMKEALLNLQGSIDSSHAQISYSNLPEVYGNNLQLTSLFQNLLSNAIKYRSEANPVIHVSAERNGEDWLFKVSDNGIGFDQQYAEYVFVLFKRLHDRAAFPGTGMGLAIAKKIVERHRGRIWVESEPNKGSTFFFTLKAADAVLPEAEGQA